jgi:hypothetical protein
MRSAYWTGAMMSARLEVMRQPETGTFEFFTTKPRHVFQTCYSWTDHLDELLVCESKLAATRCGGAHHA